jgi:LuxR family maltose regulon positive regulatory protein
MNNISENSNDMRAYHASPPDSNHLVRPRIHTLIESGIGSRVVVVCAGAGCGKTRAVSDFLKQQKRPFFWISLSEQDNSPACIWENLINSVAGTNMAFAEKCREIGLPDTTEKLNLFEKYRSSMLGMKPCITVCDDFHLLKEPSILGFFKKIINGLTPNLTLILICRDISGINIESLQMRDLVTEINESDLNFTQSELTDCFKQQRLSIDSQTMREIHRDTAGWAFAVNLVVRSLKRVPKYTGFVKTTFKPNIFEIMETENWSGFSRQLQHFLLHLSLISHISAELVEILAGGDEELLSELKQQSAYIRFDYYGGAYLIHHLYLEFLKSKQNILNNEEKNQTYKAAADWCNRNNFITDALNYYEKIGDYESIVLIYFKFFEHTTHETMLYATGIFERASEETYNNVPFFAAMHLYNLLCLGRWQELFSLAEAYEQKLIVLPENDTFRNHTLGLIYYIWGNIRFLVSTFDDRYDFDEYYKKMADCLYKSPTDLIKNLTVPLGAWGSMVGSAEAGAPQRFIDCLQRTVKYVTPCFKGLTGADDFCRGELKFYQNDVRTAELYFHKALEAARENNQFEIIQRSLFYILRFAIMQGNLIKAEQTLKALKALLDEDDYSRRNITYDIVLGWYYSIVRQFNTIPDWLKSEFSPYGHAYFHENFANQIRARYYYLSRNFFPVLTYIGELKKRESILFGRVEMLAMEACIHYQMKNKSESFKALQDAYRIASPNQITTPFIELGKDMRTLTMAVIREESCPEIPRPWLESIKNKSTSYAKNQSMFINEHKLSEAALNKALSAREQDVLSDLYHGFSQAEIARKHSLSVNTVKMVTKSIYEKLHVHKISDLIRVAAEQRLV